MAGAKTFRKKLHNGVIDTLGSGALRVRVDAGLDPVTKRRHRRTRVIPADTPDKEAVAERTRVQLVNEVYENRHPRTEARLRQLIERYLDDFEGAWSTRNNYRSLWEKHVEPFLGDKKVGEIDADILDSLYRELRRCRDHCSHRFVQHRTARAHECDQRCRWHGCKPLGVSGRRQIHWLLSGAFSAARRWKWVTDNPVSDAKPAAPPVPKPTPPTPTQAAAIVNEAARRDESWATLVWLAMTTGARRHELCALRWTDLVADDGATVLWVRRGISKDDNGRWAEQDTKDHQQRPVTLDPETVQVLSEHRDRCERSLAELRRETGIGLAEDAFLFSPAPAYDRFYTPGAITQRFDGTAQKAGVDTTFHKLRHYSATELIKAGVDINTVSGRLGHGGGGTTTLKVYTAFVSEADQRAAGTIGARMPVRDWQRQSDPIERAKTDPRAPFEAIAAQLRQEILAGTRSVGEQVPSIAQLAEQHDVSAGTVTRAMTLLRTWGLITDAGRGRRPTVMAVGSTPRQRDVQESRPREHPAGPASHDDETAPGQRVLDLRLLHLGTEVRSFSAKADPSDADHIDTLLRSAARRHHGGEPPLGDYEVEVRDPKTGELFSTFAAL